MHTYRQLLQKCNKDVLRDILVARTRTDLFYSNVPADELEERVQSIVAAYMEVASDLLKKEGEWPVYAIILELVADELFDEKTLKPTGEYNYYINTNYYNSTAKEVPADQSNKYFEDKKYQKYLGFGLSPWSEFIDSDVVISPDVAVHLGIENLNEKIVAEILWEQTWYGFTEAQSQDFKNMLTQRVNDIENGKLKTKKLKKRKGDKYTVEVPVDMLAPVKKKRSKKKK